VKDQIDKLTARSLKLVDHDTRDFPARIPNCRDTRRRNNVRFRSVGAQRSTEQILGGYERVRSSGSKRSKMRISGPCLEEHHAGPDAPRTGTPTR
jgi:hypothetical protein